MKTNKRGEIYGIEVAIITVIVLCLVVLFWSTCSTVKKQYSHETYVSWCKLHQRTDFTYEEWKEMRRAGLLDPETKVVPVVIPIQTGR